MIVSSHSDGDLPSRAEGPYDATRLRPRDTVTPSRFSAGHSVSGINVQMDVVAVIDRIEYEYRVQGYG